MILFSSTFIFCNPFFSYSTLFSAGQNISLILNPQSSKLLWIAFIYFQNMILLLIIMFIIFARRKIYCFSFDLQKKRSIQLDRIIFCLVFIWHCLIIWHTLWVCIIFIYIKSTCSLCLLWRYYCNFCFDHVFDVPFIYTRTYIYIWYLVSQKYF